MTLKRVILVTCLSSACIGGTARFALAAEKHRPQVKQDNITQQAAILGTLEKARNKCVRRATSWKRLHVGSLDSPVMDTGIRLYDDAVDEFNSWISAMAFEQNERGTGKSSAQEKLATAAARSMERFDRFYEQNYPVRRTSSTGGSPSFNLGINFNFDISKAIKELSEFCRRDKEWQFSQEIRKKREEQLKELKMPHFADLDAGSESVLVKLAPENYFKLADERAKTDFEGASLFYDAGVDEALKQGKVESAIFGFNRIGNLQLKQAEFAAAVGSFNNSLTLIDKERVSIGEQNLRGEQSAALSGLGKGLYGIGDYKEAAKLFLRLNSDDIEQMSVRKEDIMHAGIPNGAHKK